MSIYNLKEFNIIREWVFQHHENKFMVGLIENNEYEIKFCISKKILSICKPMLFNGEIGDTWGLETQSWVVGDVWPEMEILVVAHTKLNVHSPGMFQALVMTCHLACHHACIRIFRLTHDIYFDSIYYFMFTSFLKVY